MTKYIFKNKIVTNCAVLVSIFTAGAFVPLMYRAFNNRILITDWSSAYNAPSSASKPSSAVAGFDAAFTVSAYPNKTSEYHHFE